jgi:hypothetical protein
MRPKKIALPLILTLSPLILILAAEASERNGVGAGERPSSHAGSRAQARGRPSERSTKRSNQHRQQHGNTVQASNRPRTGTFLRTTQSKNRYFSMLLFVVLLDQVKMRCFRLMEMLVCSAPCFQGFYALASHKPVNNYILLFTR